MVKKIYNVVLQSLIGDGTTNSNETFFYDWSQIPDVPYKVNFSFVSGVVSPMISVGQYASVYIDLAQSYNQLATAQSSPASYKGQFLGNLFYLVVTAGNTLYAEANSNPPTFLNGRPQNNNFRVEIHSSLYTDFTPTSGPYCLILSFQEV